MSGSGVTATVAVVGTSPAGLSAARALRAQSYDGRIVVVLGVDQPRLSTRRRRQLRSADPATP